MTNPSLPTSSPSGQTHFRTSVIQLDRPGDPSVFGQQVRDEAAQIVARYPEGQSRSALLPMLHLVQSEQGYVTADGIAFCAEVLGLTKAQVAAVVTFYTMFKRQPTGEYLVSVCTNTLCGMLGGDEIFAALVDKLGVGHGGGPPGSAGVAAGGGTTSDGRFTLEHAECLAACDYAPVVTVNYEFFDNQTVSSAHALINQLQDGERPEPSRGAPLCSFRQIERQIAGFFDEQSYAQNANGSGAPTEAGVRLAVQRGESAPSYAVGTPGGAVVTEGSGPAGRPTSAHDAPLPTAESDQANPAKPAGEKDS